MSVYQSFPTAAAALEAFAAGRCRRHVEIEGHVVDLAHARDRREVAPEEPAANAVSLANVDRATWDRDVARNVAVALAAGAVLPPSAASEVTWEVYQRDVLGIVEPPARPKPGPLCPCCLRPADEHEEPRGVL